MSEDDSKGGGIDVRGKFDPLSGGAEGHFKADSSLARYLAPALYRRQVGFDNIMAGIRHKQARGEALTPQEQAVQMASVADWALEKMDNVAAVLERARAIDPDFGRYMNGKIPEYEPAKALPPAASPEEELNIPVTIEFEQKQYWWDRFWADAEGVTTDYVQRLLAEIAVRKARTPTAISLRTLDVIRCLEPDTAETFTTISQFVFEERLLPLFKAFEISYAEMGLRFTAVFDLEDAGLVALQRADYYFRELTVGGEMGVRLTGYDDLGNEHKAPLQTMVLTRAGRELYQLVKRPPTVKHKRLLARYFTESWGGGGLEWRSTPRDPWEPTPRLTDWR